mmetsp:Transcript_4589/g.13022  ORF Transcript_4589/g.13022 Transcript_4589/m.13022 type:complete len:445 (-) Transcript_4589:72-1406(-)
MKLSSLSLSLWLASSALAFSPAWKNSAVSHPTSSKTKLFYNYQREPPNGDVWSVLANTERWISTTLQDAQQGGNPLSRKEVSYVCETSQDPAMVLANVFRKLKEARQLGEAHGQEQEEFVDESDKHERATLRQTQVLVIPANKDIMDFLVFDNMISAINQARRNARDYVTDVSLERLDENMYGDGDRDWVVSVNCAHLHPGFGQKTPEQELKELQEEEESGEVDLNLQEYKKRRLQARQSPYPSVVVEVRAMAPPEFTPPPPSGPETPNPIEDVDEPIDSEFIQNLEALFSKSTLQKDGGFYDSIGSHIETVSSVTPLSVAQNWVAENDPKFDITACAFTTTDTPHVDEAYEFVFTNLAMQTTQYGVSAEAQMDAGAQKRQYLVMPNFVTSSATSLEKFAMEVSNIISTLPSIKDKVQVSSFHPEHIQEEKRCPIPVFILQWLD